MRSFSFNGVIATTVLCDAQNVAEVMLNGVSVWSESLVPAGLIIGFTGASVPTGWVIYTNADGKLLVGAGSSYSVGTSGGSNVISKAITTTTDGAHSGGAFGCLTSGVYATGAYSSGSDAGIQGGHSHTVTITGTWSPYKQQFKLIKSTATKQKIPVDGVVFSASNISSVPNITNTMITDAFAGPNTTTGLAGSNTVSLTGTTNSTGAHSHTTGAQNYNAYAGGSYSYAHSTGTHSHTVAVTATPLVKSKYLAAWTAASVVVDFNDYMIGMWESSIAPDGWAICDGTNGTPDLRDYFIKLNTIANAGVVASLTHSFSLPATAVASSGGHNHVGSYYNLVATSRYHSDNVTHTHTTVADTTTVTPEYYALTFIMKLP